MVNKIGKKPKECMNLIQNGLVRIDYKGVIDPWREALVIKLLDKNTGFRLMKNKLVTIWKLVGDYDLMDMDNGFYMAIMT